MNENSENNVFELRIPKPESQNGFLESASNNDKKLRAAQDLVYDAWEMVHVADRKALANEALSKSELCADAHSILAGHERSAQKRFARYQMAVNAGKKALGEKYIENNRGMLWGDIDSRPYIRALSGLSQTFYELGRMEEAILTTKEILQLNQSDNMGMRYILLSWLLEDQNWKDVDQLLRSYKDDCSPEWAWAKVLRAHDKGTKSIKTLIKKALQFNSHIPAYLTGKRKLPKVGPDQFIVGSEEEAISYCIHYKLAWKKIPGAIELLL